MRFAGVSRVLVYDAYEHQNKSEALCRPLAEHWSDNDVWYRDWSHHTPYLIEGTQVRSYDHAIKAHRARYPWQLAMDIDEYPVVRADSAPAFLLRLIGRLAAAGSGVAELSFPNYIYLGAPTNATWLAERVSRRDEGGSSLHKPLYDARFVSKAQVHHNSFAGHTVAGRNVVSFDIPASTARMQHYWGARLQNWGPDTPQTLAATRPDCGIFETSARVQEEERSGRPGAFF